jgi:crotonobetainyl-CoA:carnitine CoA-transferase CaiB-like acyl-CoA transferase
VEKGTTSEKPLDGIRVFELSIAIAGPMCGRYLAHFGAEVVKVESRRHPDVIRLLGPGWLPKDRSGPEVWADCGAMANEFMAGKRSVGVDLKTADGMAIARRLLERSDVFISNYSAPAVRSLGLDYESVRAVRPDVVYASISGFGAVPGTPYYDFVAWGPNQAPLVGLDDLTGWSDRAPSGFSVFSYPDFSNGLHATVAVLAALEHRDRTGEGQMIDLREIDCSARGSSRASSAVLPRATGTARRAPRRTGFIPAAAPTAGWRSPFSTTGNGARSRRPPSIRSGPGIRDS